jgi:aryl-alcohol dehydrogenase
MLGDQTAARIVPRLLDLYRQGRLSVDRLITTYPLAEINDAARDTVSGKTLKAVLVT